MSFILVEDVKLNVVDDIIRLTIKYKNSGEVPIYRIRLIQKRQHTAQRQQRSEWQSLSRIHYSQRREKAKPDSPPRSRSASQSRHPNNSLRRHYLLYESGIQHEQLRAISLFGFCAGLQSSGYHDTEFPIKRLHLHGIRPRRNLRNILRHGQHISINEGINLADLHRSERYFRSGGRRI